MADRTPRVVYFAIWATVSLKQTSRWCGPRCNGSAFEPWLRAFGDFDNDGDVDVLIMNMNEPPSLLRNDVQKGDKPRHWIKVQLIGTKSSRSAIGCRVIAGYGGKKQAQEVCAQSSYFSVNDRRLHFGLGEFDTVDITVRWLSGHSEEYPKQAADRLLVIREGRRHHPQRSVPNRIIRA